LKLISLYTESVGGVWFGVACDRQLIFATSFDTSQQKTLKSLLDSVPFNVQLQFLSEPTDFAADVLVSVKDIYDGKNILQFLPLATAHLSKYMQRVLEVTALIPVGCVTSYGAVAKVAGGSARAVGNVMATNPFVPVVPCHRVVGAGLKLGGYSS